MKILGCDYDGTLNYGGIDEEKLAAIEKWRKQGNKIGVVSGRGLDMLPVIQNQYGLELDFFVAFNGAVIYNANEDSVRKTSCVEVDLLAFVKDLFDFGCPFAHVNSDRYYLVRKSKEACKDGEYTLEDVTFKPLIYQVSVELPTDAEAGNIVPLIASRYGEFLTPLQNGRCIDIVPRGVGKANGMEQIQQQFGVEWKDVIVVGDNLNDADMLQAFTSYAMENGVEKIKKIATYTTKSVTDLILRELKNIENC